MINIHFYDEDFIAPRKELTYENLCSYLKKTLNLDNLQNYFFEYLIKNDDNSEGIYCLLNEKTFNKFLDNNVTDIFVYRSLEETQNYKDNKEDNIIHVKEEQEEDNPNFYEDDNIDENNNININNIQEDNFLKEKIKQTIINQQKQKIREERLKQEKEKKKKEIIKQQNEIKINFQNANDKININKNLDNDMDNQEIINIIDQNFEKFRENLINESKVQSSKIIMESKLKIQEENANDNDIETPSSVEIHEGCVCNGCGDFPIIGIRYKCVECKDFDYCEKCHADKKFIHKHPFYKLRFVIQ